MKGLIRPSIALMLAVAWLAPNGVSQQRDQSARIRPSSNINAQGNILGAKPGKVLKLIKLRGVVSKVNLETRTVTVDSKQQEDPIELAFSQPAGREQIKTAKKAIKTHGKRKMSLEELTVGSRVQCEYYTTLGQMLELLVEDVKG